MLLDVMVVQGFKVKLVNGDLTGFITFALIYIVLDIFPI